MRTDPRRGGRGLLSWLLSTLLSAALLLLLLEAALRWLRVELPNPVQIQQSAGRGDDWRPFHMFEDWLLIPDPYLMWRPRPGRQTINALGYAGPEIERAKPAGTYRILTLGDSNTMGAVDHSWPAALRQALRPAPRPYRRVEVVNGGVYGYSSLQGLRRLREALELQPDLVVIAFGWNDVAEVAGAADKDYPLPHPLMLQLQRLLLGTHTVRWLLSLRPAAAPPTGFGLHPRVALADYRSNLQRMVELARGAGAGAILSTRSHRIVYPAPNWRYRVKDYNAAVFQVARASDVPLIDAQAMVIERPELLADECHFTLEGDRVFAEQLAAVIRQMIEGGRGQDVLYWESARRSTIRNKLVTGAGGGRRSLVRLLETR